MISIVLLEPENPGNIGAVARSMKNFDFKRLILISPKCDHLAQEARNRAKHAQEILTKAEVADSKALDRFDYIVGTTSKLGRDYNIPRVPITPEQLAENIDPKKKVAILIGREGDGLHNEEILRCDFVVAIPASRKYPALNMSHAATIMMYALHQRLGKDRIDSHINAISKKEKEQILKMVDSILDKMSFRRQDEKETQRKVWRRMISKSFMSKREAFALMGFLRKLM